MRIPITEKIGGTTIRCTYVSSGVVPDSICSTLLDSTEALVNSVTGVSSGNGLFYALHSVPRSPAWFVNEWISVINANTYVNRQFIRSVHPEV